MRSILRNHRFRRDARTLEDEEEMWFNDEEDMEDGEAVVPPSDKMKNDEDLMDPISKFMERKKRKITSLVASTTRSGVLVVICFKVYV